MAKPKSKKRIVIKMSPKKRGRGRPRKDVVINNKDMVETAGIPGLLQPTEYDMMDELTRLDSFQGGFGGTQDEV